MLSCRIQSTWLFFFSHDLFLWYKPPRACMGCQKVGGTTFSSLIHIPWIVNCGVWGMKRSIEITWKRKSNFLAFIQLFPERISYKVVKVYRCLIKVYIFSAKEDKLRKKDIQDFNFDRSEAWWISTNQCKLSQIIIPCDIVGDSFTPLWDNLSRNSCILQLFI